jgi:hypothetical protein
MFRRVLVAAVVLLALASGATSLAGNGYKVIDASWSRPPRGSVYSVNAHGVAAHKALLRVYLARKPCRSTWASEARLDVTRFKAGQSYFRQTRRGLVTLSVSGRFNKSFTARAGSTAQTEYACAYLTTRDSHGRYRITAAHASDAYTVTAHR